MLDKQALKASEQMISEGQLLNVSDAADFLGISRQYVNIISRDDGDLESYELGTRMITKESLEAYKEKRAAVK